MLTVTSKLKCGGCGCDTVRLLAAKTTGNENCLVATCTHCNSNTLISIWQSREVHFDMRWPSNVEHDLKDGEGILAPFGLS
jgi:hypothetical protein